MPQNPPRSLRYRKKRGPERVKAVDKHKKFVHFFHSNKGGGEGAVKSVQVDKKTKSPTKNIIFNKYPNTVSLTALLDDDFCYFDENILKGLHGDNTHAKSKYLFE